VGGRGGQAEREGQGVRTTLHYLSSGTTLVVAWQAGSTAVERRQRHGTPAARGLETQSAEKGKCGMEPRLRARRYRDLEGRVR